MRTLRGILFDYGHTLVWFPKYAEARVTSARNVRQVLLDLGVSVEVSRAQALIESCTLRPNDTTVSAEEEATRILLSTGVKKFVRNDLKRIIQAEWKPYIQDVRTRKGVKEALENLKMRGLKLGILANIWSGAMNPVLARLGLADFFDTTVADMDVGFSKPTPRIFRLALDRLQLLPEQAVMVGDNPKTDIQGAHELGVSTVRLMRGPNRTQPDSVKTDFKIRNFSTLPSVVDRLAAR